ncbi:MAG: hypothetical protein NTU76_00990 [Candidatus Taylorbacteria bacterium]|nr:hypothetical protein [Candidatus Taylorbacteria bacterium]
MKDKKTFFFFFIKKKSENYFLLVVGLASIVFAFVLFGGNIKAEMGIIDDHTYVENGVLNDHSIVWKSFVNAPEIQSFGNHPRFRIVYNLINNIQTALWGLDASYWYFINVLVFAFFMFCVFFIVYRNFGKKFAFIFTLFVASSNYFAHIFTRLGTAEVWTILGLSIFSLGASSIYQKTQKKINSGLKDWLPILLGSFIMLGSKENFVIVGILILVIVIFLRYKKILNRTAIFLSSIALILNIYVILHIILTQKRQEVDFYQNNVGILYRLKQISQGFFSEYSLFFSIPVIFFIFILALFLFFYLRKRELGKFKKHIFFKLFISPLLTTIILTIVYLFNLYIYDGESYILHRYAFPSLLIVQILLLTMLKWISDFKNYYFPNFKTSFFHLVYFLFLLVLSFFIFKNINYSQEMSKKNANATVLFQNQLKKVVIEARKEPDYPIIFFSYKPLDYEPLLSVSAYLRQFGIKNKLMVKTDYKSEDLVGQPILKWVAEENIKFEKNGNQTFQVYSEDNNGKCFAVNFNGNTINTKCKNLGKIWQLSEYPY